MKNPYVYVLSLKDPEEDDEWMPMGVFGTLHEAEQELDAQVEEDAEMGANFSYMIEPVPFIVKEAV